MGERSNAEKAGYGDNAAWIGNNGKIGSSITSYSFAGDGKSGSRETSNEDDGRTGISQAGFLEPAAKVVKEWWLDVNKFGDRVYKSALAQKKSIEQAERARNKAMRHYRGYKIATLTASAAAKNTSKDGKVMQLQQEAYCFRRMIQSKTIQKPGL